MKYRETYTLPFKYDIPTYIDKYLSERDVVMSYIKFFKRLLFININFQKSLECISISECHKRILWINISAPSLGDSLMDLSSRTLLKGREVDLFTSRKNYSLYSGDTSFNNVFKSYKEFNHNKKYDLVIIDSYSTRSIKIKIKLARKTPFVGMFGFYNGPEVNRVLFSFHRMNQLLGYEQSRENIASLSKPSIFISEEDKVIVDSINLPKKFISIVLGGEWNYRKYNNWVNVIRRLIEVFPNIKVAILGSSNALVDATIVKEKFKDSTIIDCVNFFSFNQTAEIISRSQITISCDGGLMHAANSVGAKTISLFARLTPSMQLTNSIQSFPIFDKEDVNNITSNQIFSKVIEAVNFYDISLHT